MTPERRAELQRLVAAWRSPDPMRQEDAVELPSAAAELLAEVERLTCAVGLLRAECGQTLIHQSVALTGQVRTLTAEHNAFVDAISDALHRAGVGDSPRLVDRIALAGEELHKLRRKVMDADREQAAGYQLMPTPSDECISVTAVKQDALTAERDSLAAEVERLRAIGQPWLPDDVAELTAGLLTSESLAEARRIEASSLRTERDTLRQQLEAARRELASVREVADPDNETPELSLRDRVMHVGEQAALLVSMTRMAEKRVSDLSAAQQRNAELEAVNGGLRNVIDAGNGYITILEAALRAMVPVYRAAEELDARLPMVNHGTLSMALIFAVFQALGAARAALTPELLAVIEAATK